MRECFGFQTTFSKGISFFRSDASLGLELFWQEIKKATDAAVFWSKTTEDLKSSVFARLIKVMVPLLTSQERAFLGCEHINSERTRVRSREERSLFWGGVY